MTIESLAQEHLKDQYKEAVEKLKSSDKLIKSCLKFLKDLKTFDDSKVEKGFQTHLYLDKDTVKILAGYENTWLGFFEKKKEYKHVDPLDFPYLEHAKKVDIPDGEVIVTLSWNTMKGKHKEIIGHEEDVRLKEKFKELFSKEELTAGVVKVKASFRKKKSK